MPVLSDPEFILRKFRSALSRIEGSTQAARARADADQREREFAIEMAQLQAQEGPEGPYSILGAEFALPQETSVKAQARERMAAVVEALGWVPKVGIPTDGFDAQGNFELSKANDRLQKAILNAGNSEEAKRLAEEGENPGFLNKALGWLDMGTAFVQGLLLNKSANPADAVRGAVTNSLKAASGQEYEHFKVGGNQLVGDILFDPFTYLSFGLAGVGKEAGVQGAKFLRGAANALEDVAVREAVQAGNREVLTGLLRSHADDALRKASGDVGEAAGRTALSEGKSLADVATSAFKAIDEVPSMLSRKGAKNLAREVDDTVGFLMKLVDNNIDPGDLRKMASHLDDAAEIAKRRGPLKAAFRTLSQGDEAGEAVVRAMPSRLKPGAKLQLPFQKGGVALTGPGSKLSKFSQAGRVSEALERFVPGAVEFIDKNLDHWYELRKGVATAVLSGEKFRTAKGIIRDSVVEEGRLATRASVAARNIKRGLVRAGLNTSSEAEEFFGTIERTVAEAGGDVRREAPARVKAQLIENGVDEDVAQRAADGWEFMRFDLLETYREAGGNMGELAGYFPRVGTKDAKKKLDEFHKRRSTSPAAGEGTSWRNVYEPVQTKGRTATEGMTLAESNAWFRSKEGVDLFEEDIQKAYMSYGRGVSKGVSRQRALTRLAEEGVGAEVGFDMFKHVDEVPNPNHTRAREALSRAAGRVVEAKTNRAVGRMATSERKEATRGAQVAGEVLHPVRRAQGAAGEESKRAASARRASDKARAARGGAEVVETSAAGYHKAFDATVTGDKAVFVTRHEAANLKKKSWKVFRSKDGKAGVLVKPLDAAQRRAIKKATVGKRGTPSGPWREVSGLFATGGRSWALLKRAVQEGGNYLEAYDSGLVDYYKSLGFREVARSSFDPKYLDDDQLAAFERMGIKPDYVTMVLSDAAAKRLLAAKTPSSLTGSLRAVGKTGVGDGGGDVLRRVAGRLPRVPAQAPISKTEEALIPASLRAEAQLRKHVAAGRIGEDVADELRKVLNDPHSRDKAERVAQLLEDKSAESVRLAARWAKLDNSVDDAVASATAASARLAEVPETVLRKRFEVVRRNVPEGYVVARKAFGAKKGVAIPREVHDMLRNVIDFYEAPGPIGAAIDKFMGAWRSMAVSTPGFVLRNAYGIMWQNFALAGVSPRSAAKAMAALFGDFGSTARQTGEAGRVSNVVRKLAGGSSEESRRWLDLAGKHGVIDKNFYEAVRGFAEVGQYGEDTLRRVWKDVNLSSGDNIITRTIFRGQAAVENWARLSVFIDAVDNRGMSAADAVERSNFFHFAYDELTPGERRWGRRGVSFYTWMKNNMSLQLQSFTQTPRKLLTVQRAVEAQERNVGTDAGEARLGKFAKLRLAFPIVSKLFLLQDLPFTDLNNLPITVQDILDPDVRENLAPPVKLFFEVFGGARPFERDSVFNDQAAPSWAEIPGVKQALQRIGAFHTDKRTGKNYLSTKAKFMVEEAVPWFKRWNDLSPNEQEAQEKRWDRIFSIFFGVGIKTVTTGEQTRETVNRARTLERMRRATTDREKFYEREREAG